VAGGGRAWADAWACSTPLIVCLLRPSGYVTVTCSFPPESLRFQTPSVTPLIVRVIRDSETHCPPSPLDEEWKDDRIDLCGRLSRGPDEKKGSDAKGDINIGGKTPGKGGKEGCAIGLWGCWRWGRWWKNGSLAKLASISAKMRLKSSKGS